MQRYRTQYGKRGMVASAHPLATFTGLKVLEAGGNAVDAAVAMAGTTSVVIPAMCGLGGDVFALVYDARQKQIWNVGSSGAVPEGASLEYFKSLGYDMMPSDGMLSVAVPGAVDGYFAMLSRFGSMPITDLWHDALRYARAGFAVTPELHAQIKQNRTKLEKCPETGAIFLPCGRVPEVGDTLYQTDLGQSLEKVARHGPDVFYRGELADRLVSYSRQQGGLFDGSELASHQADVREPLSTTYREYEIYQTAPPSQGHIMLEQMNILEGFDLEALGPQSVDLIHLMVEAKRLAYFDRNKYMGDPRFVDAPLKTLISKKHATRRRLRIDTNRAMTDIPDDVPHSTGDTTSFVVIDRWGNAVSFIHSLSHAFGSGVTVPGTGILLNNRAGRGFTLVKGHPNCVAPGKKTMHTLNAFIVTRDGLPYLIANTPGGDGQPQHNMQMAINVLDFHMDPQQAAEAPRWTHSPGTDPAGLADPVTLRIESRFPESVIEGLRKRGHNVSVVGPWAAGGTFQLILADLGRALYMGGTDPRGEGLAQGY